MAACAPRAVGGFVKNSREELRAEISEHRGRCYGHLRIFVPSAAAEGEWIRTAKGVAVPIELLSELVGAVRRLRDVASERTVGRIALGEDELRVSVRIFKGNQYVDVRTYYRDGEEWKPSPKGVTASVAMLEEFVELVEKLATAASGD
jgi:hypothetical protein